MLRTLDRADFTGVLGAQCCGLPIQLPLRWQRFRGGFDFSQVTHVAKVTYVEFAERKEKVCPSPAAGADLENEIGHLSGSSYPALMPNRHGQNQRAQFARLERLARERHVPKAQVLREGFGTPPRIPSIWPISVSRAPERRKMING